MSALRRTRLPRWARRRSSLATTSRNDDAAAWKRSSAWAMARPRAESPSCTSSLPSAFQPATSSSSSSSSSASWPPSPSMPPCPSSINAMFRSASSYTGPLPAVTAARSACCALGGTGCASASAAMASTRCHSSAPDAASGPSESPLAWSPRAGTAGAAATLAVSLRFGFRDSWTTLLERSEAWILSPLMQIRKSPRRCMPPFSTLLKKTTPSIW
mmetsp:Transcript_121168/g.337500  ORF Transcript_121168/g.337500 Transcript_121168/m.337500 type:complete len:215 (-) Transcript_121168:308-952(-)